MTHVWTHPDPIHAAITRHGAAYLAFRFNSESAPGIEANDEYDAASEALVSTACTSRFGALTLLSHLRCWLLEEAEFAAGLQPAYGLARVRAADLALFLGENAPPAVIPTGLPPGGLPPTRRAVDLRRAMRPLALAAEGPAAVALVVGGGILAGLATRL